MRPTTLDIDNFSLDHILPVSRDGKYFLTNMPVVLLSGRREDARCHIACDPKAGDPARRGEGGNWSERAVAGERTVWKARGRWRWGRASSFGNIEDRYAD
jgi:hypothetical protein